jgi:hypothetical protein
MICGADRRTAAVVVDGMREANATDGVQDRGAGMSSPKEATTCARNAVFTRNFHALGEAG